MLEKLKAAICFMDLKKRMAGACEETADIGATEAEWILFQIRRLAS